MRSSRSSTATASSTASGRIPIARAFLADRFKRGESVIFIAMVGGAAAGFTQLYPSFSSVSLKRLWILNDLFVDPNVRRAGVGRALLDRARALAVETKAKGLALSTQVSNGAAHRLYVSLGWKRDDEFRHYHLFL